MNKINICSDRPCACSDACHMKFTFHLLIYCYFSFSASVIIIILIIIMYFYHALINALSAHMIHINLNTIYTYVEHSPTRTIYIKYYNFLFFFKRTHTHTHTDCSRNWVLILVRMEILWEEEGFQFHWRMFSRFCNLPLSGHHLIIRCFISCCLILIMLG